MGVQLVERLQLPLVVFHVRVVAEARTEANATAAPAAILIANRRRPRADPPLIVHLSLLGSPISEIKLNDLNIEASCCDR